MQSLKLLAAIALAALVHFVGVRLWPDFARAVDVFLVVVALHGLRGNSLSGLLVGLLVGLLQDTLTSGPFGLFGFADTIIGYVTARLAQRLVIQRPTRRPGAGQLRLRAPAGDRRRARLPAAPRAGAAQPGLGGGPRGRRAGSSGWRSTSRRGRWRSSSETRRRGRMSRLRLG